MKSMTKKLLLLVTGILLFALILSSCGLDSTESNEVSDEARQAFIEKLIYEEGAELLFAPQIEDMDVVPSSYKNKQVSQSEGGMTGLTNMYLMLENENYKLYMDFKTTDIAVLDLKTGYAYHSNPDRDPDTTMTAKAHQQNIASPLSLEAFDASGKRYSFNFFGNCYDEGQGAYYVVKNGDSLRLIYTIGNDPDKDLFPPVITEDTFENRILKGLDQKLAEKAITEENYEDFMTLLGKCYRYMTPKDIDVETKERFKSTFPTIDVMTLYVSYDKVTSKQKREIKVLMETIGFTVKDVKKEMEKADYQGPERAVLYTIPVDLSLTEDGLKVNIDSSLILGPTKQRLYTINVYRGFGALSCERKEGGVNYNDGYMIVPDGSGAIIPALGNRTRDVYKGRIFGADGSFDKKYDTDYSQQVLAPYVCFDRGTLPSNATRLNGGGIIAIMEDGAAQASVIARPYVSSNACPVASVNYELVYSERDYRTYTTSYVAGAAGTDSQTGSGLLLSKDDVTGNFTIQYLFTEGSMSYSEYAQTLRSYYIKKGYFPAETLQENQLPFYVDLIGCVDLSQTFLGIPVQTETALTSYAQAQEIMTKLNEAGLGNVVARYSFWANGGENNFIARDLELLDCMGTKNELNALIQYCNDNNMGFYPSVEFLQVTSDSNGFSTSQDAARRMNRSTATIVERLNAIGALREDLEEKILVSSKVSAEISETYKASFESVISSKNIALGTLGKGLHSNYRTNEGVTRSWAEKDHVKIMETFAGSGYELVVSTGNSYTWKYATHIFGLPSGSTEYHMQTSAIPFAQMLLHGYVNYSLDPINETGDYDTALLLMLETGAAPAFRWMGADDSVFDYTAFYNYFSLEYSATFDRAVELYKKAAEVLNDVVNEPITKHEALDSYYTLELEGLIGWKEPVPDATTGLLPTDKEGNVIYEAEVERISAKGGVFATTYGDKKVVIVNYNPFDVELVDRTVVSAGSYKVCTVAEYEAIINGSAYEPLPEVQAPAENNGQEG